MTIVTIHIWKKITVLQQDSTYNDMFATTDIVTYDMSNRFCCGVPRMVKRTVFGQQVKQHLV